MYCKYCGKEIEGGVRFCEHCGKDLEEKPEAENTEIEKVETPDPSKNDDSNIGWGILSFLIPIVGLVLFLVWNDKYPARAKTCGIGALAGVIMGIVIGMAVSCSGAMYIDPSGDSLVMDDFPDEELLEEF